MLADQAGRPGDVMNDLPHPQDVVEAYSWLLQGAPGAHRNYSAPKMVKILIDLLDALPSHHKLYCHGTHENTVAYMSRELEGILEELDETDPPVIPEKTKDRIAFLKKHIAERSEKIEK